MTFRDRIKHANEQARAQHDRYREQMARERAEREAGTTPTEESPKGGKLGRVVLALIVLIAIFAIVGGGGGAEPEPTPEPAVTAEPIADDEVEDGADFGQEQPEQEPEQEPLPDDIEVAVMSEQFVRDFLRAPATAGFPMAGDEQYVNVEVVNRGREVFRVTSHVDSENGFGAQIRSPYTAKLRHLGDGEWRLMSLTLDGEKLV